MKLGNIAVALSFLLSSAAFAGTVAIFPVDAINVHADDARVIGQFFASKYEMASGQKVIRPDEAGKALEEGKSMTAAATALNVDEYIEMRAFGLDSNPRSRRCILAASRKARSGEPIWNAELSLTSVADLEQGATRLADALLKKTTLEETRTHRNVVAAETRVGNRVRSQTMPSFKTAVGYPVAANQRFSPISTTTFDLRLEQDRYFGNFGLGLVLATPSVDGSAGYGGLAADLGLNYYLTDGNTAPYVGGGIMPRILTPGIAPAPYAQLGLVMNRDSSPQFFAELRVAQNILPMSVRRVGGAAYPTEIGLSVGLGF